MPRAKNPCSSALLDAWGRANNRRLADKACARCGAFFKPHRASGRYCSRPCAWANNGGHNRKPETWWINGQGYLEGWAEVNGQRIRCKQHRLIAAQMIGRPLNADEDVHHKNGIKTDNRPENLEVVSHEEHSRHHNLERKHRSGYRLNLTEAERQARADRMRQMRSVAKAAGAAP